MARISAHVVQASSMSPLACRAVPWFLQWFMDATPLSAELTLLAGVPANTTLPAVGYEGQSRSSLQRALLGFEGLHQEVEAIE
ncbi:hypothetical protein B0J17DRAFT_770880 [Rhizoctonia solani]|nr:hypothetical protein B0J17DRAFT_770880 [Rhizoctonia solani]